MSNSHDSNNHGERKGGAPARLLLLASTALAVMVGFSPAWANNDPHRMFLPSGPFDIAPNVCGFPIHVDIPVDREYGTFSQAPDGSTVLKVTGSLVWSLTNVTNSNSIRLNASGPGTITFPPNSTLAIVDEQGLDLTYVTNGAQFGLPNLMYTSGSFGFTTDLSNDTIVSVARQPHVKLDVCAAIS